MFEMFLENIGNIDETLLYFAIPGNTAVNRVGNKSVTVKTIEHEKQHFTVVISCQADEKNALYHGYLQKEEYAERFLSTRFYCVSTP